jgi:type IV pilus assembly protein PilW
MSLNTHTKQKGFSLIELMIAMMLGIFITGGLIQLFINSKQSYRVQENLSRLQENGRFAMNFIRHDIRMAGYMGCSASTRLLKNTLNDNTSFNYDFTKALVGFNATGTDNWTPTLDTGIPEPLTDRDIITIRGILGSGVDIIGQPAAVCNDSAAAHAANLKVVNNAYFADNDIVLAGNCENMAIFQISQFNSGEVVVHNTGAAVPGNAEKDLGACFAGNGKLYKLSTRSYFIRNNPQNIPTLYRKDGTGNAEQMVEGIEDMQILYGEDTDNDNTPNYYLPAGTAGLNMDNVVSIRVSLVVSTLVDNLATQAIPYTVFDNTVTPIDRRLRRVFTSTVAIRNRLP